MNTSKIRRGDMFYADFAPVVGSEQSGSRPVIVVQNNIGNKHSPTIIVVPLTRKPKKPLPTHVVIPKSNGLDRDSFVLTEQVRTLDRSRFSKYIGHISDDIMCKVNRVLSISMDLGDCQSKKGEMLTYKLCPNCEADWKEIGYCVVQKGFHEVSTKCNIT